MLYEVITRSDQERGSQVGLPCNQHGRYRDQNAGDDELTRSQIAFVAMKKPGEHQRHRDLHHLGGLKTHHADAQPPARTVDDIVV